MTNPNLLEFDIIIIGCSFVGMTSALALNKNHGHLKIAVVEKQNIFNSPKKTDGRAYALSKSSLDLLQEINILPSILNNSGIIKQINITDGACPYVLHFNTQQTANYLGIITENHLLFEALKKNFQAKLHANITLFCPNYYQDISFLQQKAVILLDNNQQITAPLLLACDGRFSALRQKFNIYTYYKNYHQTAIVFKIKHELSHQNIAFEKFFSGGPLAILPLADNNQSSIVLILPQEKAKLLLTLDNANFTQQLNKQIHKELGTAEIISELFSYPLSAVQAENFVYQQVLLLGDAACGVHPIAGQGFNLAISNLKLLLKLLQTQITAGLPLNQNQFLQNFALQAKKQSVAMLFVTDVLDNLFKNNSQSLGIARKIGLFTINHCKIIKNFFIAKAGGK
jgi:2-octaprenyl-6-methoxyphenol hydroxylase